MHSVQAHTQDRRAVTPKTCLCASPDLNSISTGSPVQVTLSANLICGVRCGPGIERPPSRIAIGRAPVRELHGGAIHDRLEPWRVGIWDTSADHGTAAPQPLGIYVGVVFADAGLGQRADDAAGRATCDRAGQRRY